MQKVKKGQVIQKTENRKFTVIAFQKFTAELLAKQMLIYLAFKTFL